MSVGTDRCRLSVHRRQDLGKGQHTVVCDIQGIQNLPVTLSLFHDSANRNCYEWITSTQFVVACALVYERMLMSSRARYAKDIRSSQEQPNRLATPTTLNPCGTR